jgi:hypothetical protein
MIELVRSRAQWAAVAVGAAVAVLLLSTWIVQGGSATAPARVTLVAERSNDLDVHPVTGPLGTGTLRPSSPALVRVVKARNPTGGKLMVSLRAAPDDPGLDSVLAFRIRHAGVTIFDGSLADLRTRGTASFELESHKTTGVEVSAWIPLGSKGYGARDETVPLRFVTRPSG